MSQTDEIEIPTHLRMQLRDACEAASPRECCGLLLGSSDGDRPLVRRVEVITNPVSGTGAFAIPDHELRRVRWLTLSQRIQILAVFHSHPGASTELSRCDRASLTHSEWPWLVITVNETTRDLVLAWYRAADF